jgi:hypothetical protein
VPDEFVLMGWATGKHKCEQEIHYQQTHHEKHRQSGTCGSCNDKHGGNIERKKPPESDLHLVTKSARA